jgi:hypothetical protein
MVRKFGWGALVLACASTAAADKIVLKGGGTYEGRVLGQTDSGITMEILVSGKPVKITVASSQIESFERSPSVFEKYEERAAKVNRTDADALVDLAGWCRDQHLVEQSAGHLQEALAANPEHAVAIRMIKAMGYVKDGSKWVPEVELKRSQGLEKYGNEWIPKEEASKRRAEADAAWRADQERKRYQNDVEMSGRAKVRVEREEGEIKAKLEGTLRDLLAAEAKVKQLEKDKAEAEKKLNAAVARRDSAKAATRNLSNNPNDRNNNDGAYREYSQAKKDLSAADAACTRVLREYNRAVSELKGLQTDREMLEKKLKDKQAEETRIDARRETLQKQPPK